MVWRTKSIPKTEKKESNVHYKYLCRRESFLQCRDTELKKEGEGNSYDWNQLCPYGLVKAYLTFTAKAEDLCFLREESKVFSVLLLRDSLELSFLVFVFCC